MQPTRLPRKKDVALQLLEQATVFVHLDPRAEAVRVPLWFKKQPQLVLQIGLNMAVPIPDLDVDDNGLSCTLSFNRSPFMCVIPWSAVFALVDENRQGMVWPDDVPPELAAQAAQAKAAPARPELKVAPSPKDEAPVKTAAKTAPSAKAKRARKAATKTRTRPEPVAKRVAEPAVKRAAAGAKARAAAPAAKPRAVAKRAPAAVAQKAAPQKAPAQKAPAAQKAAPRAEPAIAPAPAAAAGGGSKRKLPPYLRIVK